MPAMNISGRLESKGRSMDVFFCALPITEGTRRASCPEPSFSLNNRFEAVEASNPHRTPNSALPPIASNAKVYSTCTISPKKKQDTIVLQKRKDPRSSRIRIILTVFPRLNSFCFGVFFGESSMRSVSACSTRRFRDYKR